MGNRIHLKHILDDKVSGSSELLGNLNSYFLQHVAQPEKIRKDIEILKEKLPHFSAINNYIIKIGKLLDSKDTKRLKSFLKEFDKLKENSHRKIYANAKEHLSKLNNILTLSNSKTLLEVFKLWYKENKNIKITVCESRPKYEGLIFAKALAKAGIKVEVITDASVCDFVEKIDAVIIGADKILKNGNVINKTGSRNAAIICRYFKKPFIVLATKDKFTNKKTYTPIAENPGEVLNKSPENISVHNYYFEEIEKSLITKIITD